jgi:NAD(P)-dependent dehydrogenase (short-subunit alcohol dehydrogenase family)
VNGGRFTGKTALVTGGESGIGAAIVRRLRLEGARVLAAGLRADLLADLAHETGADACRCDVTDQGMVVETLSRAAGLADRLDVVVNAAGIMHADNVADIEDVVWERLLAVNLTGTMRVCRAAIPYFKSTGGGAIVNVSSVAAFNGSAGMASYGTSKSGLIAFTRALANEYGQYRIRANCLCPGWVRTPMSEQEMRDVVRERGGTVDEAFAALSGRIALRRIAEPAEIAACACFLAADDAAFVTGAVLVADGGARTPATARGV